MNRRGRKMKLNAVRRNPARKHEAIGISPTPERAAKLDHNDFPLDGLLAKERVTSEEHQAGMEYHRLFVAVWGKPFADCAAIYRRVAGDFSREYTSGETDRDGRVEKRYHQAADALSAIGGRIPYVVHKVTIRLHPPSETELPDLQRGLFEMAGALGFLSRKAA